VHLTELPFLRNSKIATPLKLAINVRRRNSMNVTIVRRSVARIDRPTVQMGMTPEHRVRRLVPPGDPWATDPFLLLMEDWYPRGVFDRHPHRGMETVTYVIDGRLDHYDNYGNKGSILSGNVQWMTAGRGIIHNEQPPEGATVHSLQLWVNLSAADKMVEPRAQNLVAADMPLRREQGAEIRVFSGKSGNVIAPTKNFTPVTMLEVRLKAGAHIRQELPANYNAFLVVLEGGGSIGGDQSPVHAGDVVWLTRTDDDGLSEVNVAGGTAPLRVLLYAGRPLHEPVVARGPFVMNTEEQIRQAYADYHQGRFEPRGR
jgi:quercetin 2,3-dioxygenase